MIRKLIISVLFVVLGFSAVANIRHVPSTYSTIPAALAACNAGDTVLVQPGTYVGQIAWPAITNIKLLSAGDSSNTVLSGNNITGVLSFGMFIPIDSNTVVKGFKITGGFHTGTAASGGGLFIYGVSPKIEECEISGNHIESSDHARGAGVYCENSSAIFYRCSISGNFIDNSIWGYGGGIYMEGAGNVVLKDVVINNNYVVATGWNYGVGVYCSGTNASFINCKVMGNSSGPGANYYKGTGLSFENCTSTLTNVLIASNIMSSDGNSHFGGGIYLDALSSQIAIVNLMNVTITDNHRDDGISIAGKAVYFETGSFCNVVNSILWNTAGGYEIPNATGAAVTYSDIRNSFPGTGNIDSDPYFVTGTDFHLINLSPSLEVGTLAGAPAFDLDNNPRPGPAGTNPDMGCYEFSCTPTPTEINLPASVDTVCVTSGSVVLSGAYPAGGTYSGNGVSGNTFNPAIAGSGAHVITYAFTNNFNCTAYDSGFIFVSPCTGIEENHNYISVIVFPNPFSERTNVVFSEVKEKSLVRIMDIMGSEIRSFVFSGQKLIIDKGDLPAGIYYLQVINPAHSAFTRKIIIK